MTSRLHPPRGDEGAISNPLAVRANVRDARSYFERLNGAAPPVLCIVDVYLPDGENGIDFLRWLRAQPEPFGSLFVMVYTVSADTKHAAEAERLGDVRLVRKPVTEDTLTHAVLALGFVITNTSPALGAERRIEPR
jgi:response regulator of citrate/malate metabolism